jgi:hypothetical protein
MHFRAILSSTIQETAAAFRRRWLLLLIVAAAFQFTAVPVDFRIRREFLLIAQESGPSASSSPFSSALFLVPPPYDFLLAGPVGFFWMGFLLHAAREAFEGSQSKLVFDRAMAANQFKVYIALVFVGFVSGAVLAGSFMGALTAAYEGENPLGFILLPAGLAFVFLGSFYVAGRIICAPALLASGLSMTAAVSASWSRTKSDLKSIFACVCSIGLCFAALSALSRAAAPLPGAMLWSHGSLLLALATAAMSGVICRRLAPPPEASRRVTDILRGRAAPADAGIVADHAQSTDGPAPASASALAPVPPSPATPDPEQRPRSALGFIGRRASEQVGGPVPHDVGGPSAQDGSASAGTFSVFGEVFRTCFRETVAAVSRRWPLFLFFLFLHHIGSVHTAWRLRGGIDHFSDLMIHYYYWYLEPLLLTTPFDLIVPALAGCLWTLFLLHVACETAEGRRFDLRLDVELFVKAITIYVAFFVLALSASFALEEAASRIASQGFGGFRSLGDAVMHLMPFMLLVPLSYVSGRSLCAFPLIGAGRSVGDALSESWALTARHGMVAGACVLALVIANIILQAVSRNWWWPIGAMAETYGELFLGLLSAVLSGALFRIVSKRDALARA